MHSLNNGRKQVMGYMRSLADPSTVMFIAYSPSAVATVAPVRAFLVSSLCVMLIALGPTEAGGWLSPQAVRVTVTVLAVILCSACEENSLLDDDDEFYSLLGARGDS